MQEEGGREGENSKQTLCPVWSPTRGLIPQPEIII